MTPTKAQREALVALAIGATLTKVASDRSGTHLTFTFADGSRLPVTRPTIQVLERNALITHTVGRGYHLTREGLRLSEGGCAPCACPEHFEDNQGLCHVCGFPMAASFTLNGEPVDLMQFLCDNRELDYAPIVRLAAGEELQLGGGATPDAVLRRVS